MRIIVAALISLTVAVALVGPTSAFDPQSFWERQSINLP